MCQTNLSALLRILWGGDGAEAEAAEGGVLLLADGFVPLSLKFGGHTLVD